MNSFIGNFLNFPRKLLQNFILVNVYYVSIIYYACIQHLSFYSNDLPEKINKIFVVKLQGELSFDV